MKYEPISIRMDDTLVNTLKEEARRLSYEGKKDILYTDLINLSVQNFVLRIEKNTIISESDCDVVLDQSAPLSSILSNEMTEDEWLSMFGFIRNSLSSPVKPSQADC